MLSRDLAGISSYVSPQSIHAVDGAPVVRAVAAQAVVATSARAGHEAVPGRSFRASVGAGDVSGAVPGVFHQNDALHSLMSWSRSAPVAAATASTVPRDGSRLPARKSWMLVWEM
jgi:hypothetical protein